MVSKGNRERAVFVGNGARDTLHAWLRLRGAAARNHVVFLSGPPRIRTADPLIKSQLLYQLS